MPRIRRIVKRRAVHRRQIKRAVINGVEILEGNEDLSDGQDWPGDRIPIVPIIGTDGNPVPQTGNDVTLLWSITNQSGPLPAIVGVQKGDGTWTRFLIVFASCAIYFAEHLDAKNQYYFTSIPATMWWSVVTLTTTGYGDMYPVTMVGKAMAMVVMMSGVAFFALPAGIISAGFLEEFRALRIKKTHRCPNCGEHIDLDDHEHRNGSHTHGQ
jgi:hypothetical protein